MCTEVGSPEFDASSGSRWLTPDPACAWWNAYTYPTNPNSFIDPLGLDAGCSDKRAKTCRPIAAGSNDFSDLGGGLGSDTMNIGGVDVSVPGRALTLLMSGIPVYFGSSGTTSAEFTSTTFNGSGGLSNVTVVNVSGTNYNAGTGAIIGNGLQPIMTAPNAPGKPSKHVTPQIHSPYRMKPILPTWMLVLLAHQPTPAEWTMYYQTVGDTVASEEQQFVAQIQELLALGNMTPPAPLANDRSIVPLLDAMMGTYAGGTMAVGGGVLDTAVAGGLTGGAAGAMLMVSTACASGMCTPRGPDGSEWMGVQ